MPRDTPPSAERLRALAIDLTRQALAGDVVKLLTRAGPPLNSYAGWQGTPDKVSEDVQRLLSFVEEQGCVALLEDALRGPVAPAAAPGPAAPGVGPRAEDVAITETLKDELVAALRTYGSDPDELKQRTRTTFQSSEIVDKVAWHKSSIEEAALQLVEQADSEGLVWKLVAGLYKQKPGNRALATFVSARFSMLYQDPVVSRTTVKWAANGSIFNAIMVARRTPLIDRGTVRKALEDLFTDPEDAPTVLTIDGPSRAGKSYLSALVEFLTETGTKGHPETVPHTAGQHRYALLRPVQQGRLYSVQDVATDLFSSLGWKSLLPAQYKSDDGLAQEVIYEFRNQLTRTDDLFWIVADKYWDFPQAKPIVDFFVGLVREATLMVGRKKMRLILIDFPDEPLKRFIEDNGTIDAQFAHLSLDWLSPTDVQKFCEAFAAAFGGAAPVDAKALFKKIEQGVDQTQSRATLQQSWCNSLKRELAAYW